MAGGTPFAIYCLPPAMNAPEIKLAARVREGLPYPRGASWDGKGVNFALYSAHATKVEVCLFQGEREAERGHIGCTAAWAVALDDPGAF